jgi:hypothetical protein
MVFFVSSSLFYYYVVVTFALRKKEIASMESPMENAYIVFTCIVSLFLDTVLLLLPFKSLPSQETLPNIFRKKCLFTELLIALNQQG